MHMHVKHRVDLSQSTTKSWLYCQKCNRKNGWIALASRWCVIFGSPMSDYPEFIASQRGSQRVNRIYFDYLL
jgi:hypothetical protein